MARHWKTAIDAAPFRAFVRAELERLRRDWRVVGPVEALAARLGRNDRWIYKWTDPKGEYANVGVVELETVERALENAGLALWDIYGPEHELVARPASAVDRYCPRCRENTTTDDALICRWCDSPTNPKRELGKCSPLTDDELRVLYRLHADRGIGVDDLARRLARGKAPIDDEHQAADAIRAGFRRLHLIPRRMRSVPYQRPTRARPAPAH